MRRQLKSRKYQDNLIIIYVAPHARDLISGSKNTKKAVPKGRPVMQNSNIF